MSYLVNDSTFNGGLGLTSLYFLNQDSNNFVTLDGTQTLTNKTMDFNSNNFINFSSSVPDKYILHLKNNSTYYGNFAPSTITFTTIYNVNMNFDGATITVSETGYYFYNTDQTDTLTHLNYVLNGVSTEVHLCTIQPTSGILLLTVGDTLSFTVNNQSSLYTTLLSDKLRITLYKL